MTTTITVDLTKEGAGELQKLLQDAPNGELQPVNEPACGWVLRQRYYETGCGEEVITGIYVLDDLGYKFCPHCGAKIQEEQP